MSSNRILLNQHGKNMQVINVKSKIASDGRFHLDIPVEFSAGDDIEAVIVISSIKKKKETYNFSDLAGKLAWNGDTVDIQKKLRNEW